MTAKTSTKTLIEIPPLAVCERALDWKARDWEANCFAVASAFVETKLVPGVAVYGHWLGPVHPRSRFYVKSRAVPFVQHGWVLLPDGRVVDPTRWCFEARKPYVFYGDNEGQYDEGGNRWRLAVRGSTRPRWDATERRFEITKHVMSTQTWRFVEKYLELEYDGDQPIGALCFSQLLWLANASPDELGAHAPYVYDAIEKLGEVALIPMDNRRMVSRRAGVERTRGPR